MKRLIGAAVALASLGGAFAAQYSVDEHRALQARGAAEQAAGATRQKAADALRSYVRGLEIDAQAAAALQPLKAQLALLRQGRLEGQIARTIEDWLKNETDWQRFRREFAVYGISAEGGRLGILYGVKPSELASEALLAQARERHLASDVVLGAGRAYAAAAAEVGVAGRSEPSIVLLAKPLDEAALRVISERVGSAVALSDSKRVVLGHGPRAELDRLAEAVGHEAAGSYAGGDLTFTWAAGATPVASGIWLLSYASAQTTALQAERDAVTTKAISWSAGGLIAILALIIGFRRSSIGTGQSAADAGARTATGVPPRPDLEAPTASSEAPAAGGTPNRTDPAAFGATLHAAGGLPPGNNKVFGRYVLVDRLGEGGMAQVFTAVVFGAEGFRRKFVVKRLRPELASDPSVVSQFIDEANTASSLIHSNIIPVLDFGKVGDEYFLATEYILGRDLGRLTMRSLEKDGKPLPVGVVLHAIHETLRALEYAHTKTGEGGRPLAIVHRDVSPSNILVSARGEVKLFDFGIVKAAEGRVTRTQHGVVKGNVSFMAPEQARGLEVDARADLFSLGLVVFYCLAGDVLYKGGTSYEMLVKAATGPGSEELRRVGALPAPANAIVARALATEPDQRFQSAAEFAAAVAPHLDRAGATDLGRLMERLFGAEFQQEEHHFASAVPAAGAASAGVSSSFGVSQSNVRRS